MRIIGIDPGKKAAIALIEETPKERHKIRVIDIAPVWMGKRSPTTAEIVDQEKFFTQWILERKEGVERVAVEQPVIPTRRKVGGGFMYPAKQLLTQGEIYGSTRRAIFEAGFEPTIVMPTQAKHALGLSGKAIKSDMVRWVPNVVSFSADALFVWTHAMKRKGKDHRESFSDAIHIAAAGLSINFQAKSAYRATMPSRRTNVPITVRKGERKGEYRK